MSKLETACIYCKRKKGHRSDCYIKGFQDGYKAGLLKTEPLQKLEWYPKPSEWKYFIYR